ncbi:MAG: TonB-dependent receptor plug domain-containing protein [Maricaulaceae bacterium]
MASWARDLCKATALSTLAALAPGWTPNGDAHAQTVEETLQTEEEVAPDSVETITVTGSFIRRRSQPDFAVPLTTVGQPELDAIGANRIADLFQTLTINTGAENFSDAFNGQQSLGTENINLRGLGVQSTLVLLNNTRQVVTATTTADGISFVDTASLVPTIAIDRVEIITDGACPRE